MKLSFAELENIVKTLPIGLYSNHRIELVLDKNAPTSFYVPSTNTIFLSLDIINRSLETIDENIEESYKETSIRSMLYHEVAHAILTPHKLEMDDVVNIFEDERIETILNNYFLDTNFKRMVYLISKYDGSAPRTAMEAFFNLVRLRVHKRRDFLDRVEKIIDDFREIEDGSYWGSWRYKEAIWNLYEDVKDDFEKNGGSSLQEAIASGAIDDSMANGQNSGNGKIDSGEQFEATKQLVEKALESALKSVEESNNNSFNENKASNKKQGGGNGNQQKQKDNQDSTQQVGDLGENGNPSKDAGRGNGSHPLVQRFLDRNFDDDLYKSLELIIINFNKRNNSGSAMSAYSGVLNPRAAAREDYRFFDKPATVNGNNKYGTLHLNLFIDRSGSFSDNENKANTLINCLVRLERRYNKIFSFDLITCGDGETLIEDKRARYLECYDGTCMDRDMEKIYKKVQKKNTYNYNIVLYDGYCDMADGMKNGFKTFDNKNSLIISDSSNEKYLKELYSAKSIVVRGRRFSESLFDNILNTLKIAFR